MSNFLLSLNLPKISGMIFSVLVFTGWSATTARASCGDWLAHPETSHADETSQADANTATEVREVPVGHDCHGPDCRNVPSLPLKSPVPPAPTTRIQDLAVHESDIATRWCVRDGKQRTSKCCGPLPDGFGLEVDRPPESS